MALSGRYEKLNQLGEGPDCDVFRGRDTVLQTIVTLKILREEARLNQNRRDRLFNEAVAAAGKPHEQLVKVVDIDRNSGMIVSDAMASSAAALIPRGPISHERVVKILQECLSGIDHLHKQSLLHANIKPTNILFDARDGAKLADGRYLPTAGQTTLPTPRGTHKYVAPEWLDDSFGDVGPGLDLYALGLVALELLMGAKYNQLFPIDMIDPDKGWIRWHESREDRLAGAAELVPSLPPQLAAVLDRMVAKPGRDRYPSVADAREDLERWNEKPAAQETSEPSTRVDDNRPGPRKEPDAPPPPPGDQDKKRQRIDPSEIPIRPAQPVLIRLASGDNASEFIGLDADDFTIGDDATCAVVVDPGSAPQMRGVVVRVARDAEGWKLSSNRTTTLINGEPANEGAVVRSGDIIRLSPSGPDVQFVVQTQNQKRLDRLALEYLPRVVNPRRPGRPAPPPVRDQMPVRPQPPVNRPPAPPAKTKDGSHPAAPLPPTKGATNKAAPSPPQAPSKVDESLNSLSLQQRWNEYYSKNKKQANWVLLAGGVLILALIVWLLPSGGEEAPAPSSKAQPARAAATDEQPSKPIDGTTP